MTDKQLYESLGEELLQSLLIARNHFYRCLPPFTANDPRYRKLCRAWVVLDCFLDGMAHVRNGIEASDFKE